MGEPSSLTPRQETLLFAVCRDYVSGGIPSSSSGLVRAHGFPWSSATVRQELAALEREGLLDRSHHSSGRLPTAAGMQRYVASLGQRHPLRPDLAVAVERTLGERAGRPEHELRAASRVLSEVCGCVAVSFLGDARVDRIREVDVAALVPPRSMVVIEFDDRASVMHPFSIEVGDGTFDARRRRLEQHLRALCRGRTLAQAQAELRQRQRDGEAEFDRVLGEALEIGLIVCAGASLEPLWLEVAGQPKLTQAGSVDDDQLAAVLELLDDYRRLADVLCQLLPQSTDRSEAVRASVEVGVRLPASKGSVVAHQSRLTVVGCRLPLSAEGPSTGAVALVGSDRMDYAAVIPLVEYAARTLAAHKGVPTH